MSIVIKLVHSDGTDAGVKTFNSVEAMTAWINEQKDPNNYNVLSECSPACNCMVCNTSKKLSDIMYGPETGNAPECTPNPVSPQIERFSDLPDGTEFYVAQTYAYGGRKLYQKTMEDGGNHNAVEVDNTNIGLRVTGLQLVIRK